MNLEAVIMRTPLFLLGEMGGHRRVTYSNFWFKRILLVFVLRMKCKKAFNAECTLFVRDEKKEIEKITVTSKFQYNT